MLIFRPIGLTKRSQNRPAQWTSLEIGGNILEGMRKRSIPLLLCNSSSIKRNREHVNPLHKVRILQWKHRKPGILKLNYFLRVWVLHIFLCQTRGIDYRSCVLPASVVTQTIYRVFLKIGLVYETKRKTKEQHGITSEDYKEARANLSGQSPETRNGCVG